MTQKQINWILGLGLVAVLALSLGSGNGKTLGGSSFFEQFPVHFGGGLYVGTTKQLSISSAGSIATTGTLSVGSSGTTITQIVAGTCDLVGMDATQNASTTRSYDCAVAGVVNDDKVFVQLSTTTPSTNLGWRVNGASASTTSGYITISLMNLTGGNVTPSASRVGSSTSYVIYR